MKNRRQKILGTVAKVLIGERRPRPSVMQPSDPGWIHEFVVSSPVGQERNWNPPPPNETLIDAFSKAVFLAGMTDGDYKFNLILRTEDFNEKYDVLKRRLVERFGLIPRSSIGREFVIGLVAPVESVLRRIQYFVVRAPADELKLWWPPPPTLELFETFRDAVADDKRFLKPPLTFELSLCLSDLLLESDDLKRRIDQRIQAIGRPVGRRPLDVDLTLALDIADSGQVKQEPKTLNEFLRLFDAFHRQLDSAEKPTLDALELQLHRLPAITFHSLEEKRQFEASLGSLLSRVNKRVVRYDTEAKAPIDEPPSILRCNPEGAGYFRLEFFLNGSKHRENIGLVLPPLSLADPPADPRRRRSE